MQHFRNVCSFVALLLIAGCSGGNGSTGLPYGSSSSVMPQAGAQTSGTIQAVDPTLVTPANAAPASALSGTKIALANVAALTVIGKIQSFDATHVVIQAGGACGVLTLVYSAKTSFSGPALATGNVVFATGSGSCSTQLQATQIIVTSSVAAALGGTVLAVNPTYLLVQTGTSCGMVNMYLGSSTVFSPGPAAVGSTVAAKGTGSCATQLLASSITITGGASPVPSATPTAKPSPLPSATPKPTPVPTATPKPSPVPTATPKPSPSPVTPTFYVAPNGNDGSPGTLGQPFATIQHATNLTRPGYTVIVEDGTYTAAAGQGGSSYVVLQNASGSASAPIVVKAANTGKAIIDGKNYATNFCYGFNSGVNYVTVSGFNMQHCGEGGIMNNSAGKGNVSSHNIVHDIGQTQTCETTGRDGIFSGDGVVGFTSIGDTIYNIGRLPSNCSQSWLSYTNDHCVYAYGSNVKIENDTIYNCHSGWGVQIGGGSASTDGTGFTISGNTFGAMNNPGGVIGDIITFTPGGGHTPANYNVTDNTAVSPNGGYFINNIYYPGAATYAVGSNNAGNATGLIDWGGQKPNVTETGNTPSH